MDFIIKALETKKRKKLVGRGSGSGHGKTSTRGQKGQRSRSGGKGGPYLGFEGGQMPLYRRIPKRGFTHISKHKVDVINIHTLDKYFDDASTVTIEKLKEKKLIKNSSNNIKILGKGTTSKKINIELNAISNKAKEIIENAGGSFKAV